MQNADNVHSLLPSEFCILNYKDHLNREGTVPRSRAADALSEAIVRAAVHATSSGGLPAARDLGTVPARFK